MDFELDEKQQQWKDKARDFAEKVVKPVVDEVEKEGKFSTDLWIKLKEEGLVAVPIPSEYGGAGADHISYVNVIEELSKVSASLGGSLSVHTTLCTQTILTFGNDEQKKKYIPPLASGDVIGAFALTEPQAGTDAAAMESTATLDGDEYVLNGTKYFITHATIAGVFVIIAITDPEKGTKGMSAFIVDGETPGLKIGKIFDKMGIRSTEHAEVIMEDCRIPKENLLGNEGDGFKIAMIALDSGRIGIASQALGIAQGALDAAIQYAKERIQFGKPIAALQAIQWMIADMTVKADSARWLTYHAAFLEDKGSRFSKEAAMAKLAASTAAVDVTRTAIQVHGGYGYMTDLPVERYYRDAKITEIYEGTSEVQKMVISRSVLR
jgi:butyryl-CoA dehydrogenase